jgi:crotonobetainyl-CoA:carnitine CoA-transferase CaiB-like acyl-CoA transferase
MVVPPPPASPSLPLTGIRVIEAAQMISAPLAASFLSDQGADVIKVEAANGTGDRMRGLGNIRNGMGSVFHTCNRGKRSIALNTKADAGRDILVELIEGADVFIQNFRPGATERMGVGPEAMLARNPRLIYVSVSGFGASGPYADQMVYDFVIQGVTGLAAFEGGGGPPQLTKNLTIDKATALTVAQAVTAALFHRERTGEGQHLEVDMVGAGLQFVWPDGMWNHALQGDGITETPPMSANYEVRPTKNGYITLNLATNSTWPRLCAAIDPALADDPRFATYADRQRNAAELARAVDAVLAELTSEEALARLRDNDMPGGPVLALDEVHEDPQIAHNDSLVTYDSASIGPIREPRPAARFGATSAPDPRPAPRLGEHTESVLHELGRDSGMIKRMAAASVVWVPT